MSYCLGESSQVNAGVLHEFLEQFVDGLLVWNFERSRISAGETDLANQPLDMPTHLPARPTASKRLQIARV